MFACNRIEKRRADGRLARVGVEWTENRQGLDNVIFGLALLSFMIGVLVLFLLTPMVFLATPSVPARLVSAGVGLVLMSSFYWSVRISVRGRPRQLVFERDGRMLAPLGFDTYADWCKSIDGTIADIASIEARNLAEKHRSDNTIHTHGVVLSKWNGDLAYVARNLLPEEAHKVSVQLNLALKNLRDDLATAAMRQRSAHDTRPASPSRQSRASAMID